MIYLDRFCLVEVNEITIFIIYVNFFVLSALAAGLFIETELVFALRASSISIPFIFLRNLQECEEVKIWITVRYFMRLGKKLIVRTLRNLHKYSLMSAFNNSFYWKILKIVYSAPRRSKQLLEVVMLYVLKGIVNEELFNYCL